jgi:hypothetical protein
LFTTGTALAGSDQYAGAAARATLYLELSANADGSWGTDDIAFVYTSSVIDALRDSGHQDNAYFRGVTWLENHSARNLDERARKISALVPHGDDVGADVAVLSAGSRQVVGLGTGWGLAPDYGASASDTGLALIALADVGNSTGSNVDSALEYLKASETSDRGWAVRSSLALDPVVTSIVLRALSRYSSMDPTLTPIGNAVATSLSDRALASADPFVKGHAAFALQTWNATSPAVITLLDSLVSSQTAGGDWGSSVYGTAIALRALSIKLGTNSATLQTVISIPDFALRSAINVALKRNRADIVRRVDAQSVTTLIAPNSNITDLTGISELSNLALLDLRNNAITTVTPLLGMASLQTVMLQGNPWAGRECDVNGDGQIDSADVLLAARLARGDLIGTPEDMLRRKTRADVAPISGPGDGVVDSGDGAVLLHAATGASVSICNP